MFTAACRVSLLLASVGVLVAFGFATRAEAAPSGSGVEVRFCPADHVWSYPMDDRGRLQSLLLPGLAVINRGSTNLQLSEIDLGLVDHGRVLETRRFDGVELKRWAGNGPPIRGLMTSIKWIFCGDDLLPANVSAGGQVLKPGQAFLIVNQTLAYERTRDGVEVVVQGRRAGRPTRAVAQLPVREGFSKTHFIFPLKGMWYAGWGPSFHTSHRTNVPEEFAFDIAKLGGEGVTFRGKGLRFEDYYAYGAPVAAAADGRVVSVRDDQQEDLNSVQQPNETAEAYQARHTAAQNAEMAKRLDWPAGNYVIIDHGQGEYSVYAHLKPGSVVVKSGQRLRAGEHIGDLGSSGNSTEPHLHFQVCDRPDVLKCTGIPVQFSDIDILWAERPRALQSGDIVTTR